MQTTNMKIRVLQDLKIWLEERSIRNFRSMNAELNAILAAIREGEITDTPGNGFHRFAST